MTLRCKKQLLVGLSLTLWILCSGILMWGLAAPQLPAASVQAAALRNRSDKNKTKTLPERKLTTNDFVKNWERPLRRPLYDPPPPPPPKPVKKKPPRPLRVKLLATMIEPGNTMAMIQLAGGEVVYRKVGEVVSSQYKDATISEIQPGKVLVRRGEEETRLFID